MEIDDTDVIPVIGRVGREPGIEIGPRGLKIRGDNGDTEWSLEAVSEDVDRLIGPEALAKRMTTCSECGMQNIPWGQEWCFDCQPFTFMHWVMYYSPLGRLWTKMATRGRDGSQGKRNGRHGRGAAA